MPYKSLKQERWAHSPAGMKKLGAAKVAEFDAASKGMKLPEHADKAPMKKPVMAVTMGVVFGKRKRK